MYNYINPYTGNLSPMRKMFILASQQKQIHNFDCLHCIGKHTKFCSVTTRSGYKMSFWEKRPFLHNPNNETSQLKWFIKKVYQNIVMCYKEAQCEKKILERFNLHFLSYCYKSVLFKAKIKTVKNCKMGFITVFCGFMEMLLLEVPVV
jgi:hypothetical protein